MKYRELLASLVSEYVRAVECRGLSPSIGRPDIRYHLASTARALQTSEGLRRDLSYYMQCYKKFIKERLRASYNKTGYSPEVLAKVLFKRPYMRLKNDVDGIRYVNELKTFIPMIILDRSKANPPFMLRKALKREVVPRVKSNLVLSGYEVVLADESNRVIYVLFSKVSKLYILSRNVWGVIALFLGVPNIPKYFLGRSVDEFKLLMHMYYPGSVCEEVGTRDLIKTP